VQVTTGPNLLTLLMHCWSIVTLTLAGLTTNWGVDARASEGRTANMRKRRIICQHLKNKAKNEILTFSEDVDGFISGF
jgi:hypothetical protein